MNLKDLGKTFNGEDAEPNMTEARAQEIIFTHWRMAFIQQQNGRYRFMVDGEAGFDQPEGQPPVEFLHPDLFHPTSMAAAYVVFMFGAATISGVDFLFRSTLGGSILTEYTSWQAALMTIAKTIDEGMLDGEVDWDAARSMRKEEGEGAE